MNFWHWMKNHDIPNWISIAISLIVWPIALFLWKNRTVPSIRNLQINISEAGGWVAGIECRFLSMDFQNNTGQIIYLANASLKPTSIILAHESSDQNSFSGEYTLKFSAAPGTPYDQLQITINTGQRVSTGLPLAGTHNAQTLPPLIQEMRNFHREWWRPFWVAKYFYLTFDAMVGKELYRVKITY